MFDERKVEELAYLAGILDGEGSVSIACIRPKKGRAYFQPRVFVTNTGLDLIIWLEEHFGASTTETQSPIANRRLLYVAKWTGDKALTLLTVVLPYLIVKRERAALVLEAWSVKPSYVGCGHPLPDNIWQLRQDAYQELRAMNSETTNKPGVMAPVKGL
jgi:hypothetical protein